MNASLAERSYDTLRESICDSVLQSLTISQLSGLLNIGQLCQLWYESIMVWTFLTKHRKIIKLKKLVGFNKLRDAPQIIWTYLIQILLCDSQTCKSDS